MTPPTLPLLRPRSATEVVDAAIQLLRAHYGHLLQVAALGTIPSLLIVLAQTILAPGGEIPANPFSDPTQATLFGVGLLCSLLFGFAMQGALSYSSLRALQGVALPSVIESFTVGFRRLPALIGAMFLVGLLFALAFTPVALVFVLLSLGTGTVLGKVAIVVAAVVTMVGAMVFGIACYGLIAVVTSLVVLEQLGPWASLRRAFRLSSGSWLRMAGVWAIAMLLFVVIFGAIIAIMSAMGSSQIANVLGTVAGIPAAPIFGAVALVQYADLRARREGADVEAALGALGVGTPDGALPVT
ncbi:MAG: hypothetical protein MUF21_06845 [Gemmatimonadaceae bacterium]|nr:hypothetical protein [Gemmatimonadaceae bacterium]